MGCARTPRWAGLAAAALALLAGCQDQDAERLAKVGRRLAQHTEALGADANRKMVEGIQAVGGSAGEVAVDARVSARLQWDKSLAGQPIQVLAVEGKVRLVGTVRDDSQRRRAAALAEATVGVVEVSNELELAAAGQP
jgi:osmotically-inducible protein OsmY